MIAHPHRFRGAIMNKKAKPFPLLTAAAIERMKVERRRHFVNKRALRLNKSLGDAVGMSEMGVHLVRIKQGDDTTEFHSHFCDEEFVYILSGHGIAEIGTRRIKVGPGDFMGFTAKSLPHGMTNPNKEDLVYLLGGTRKPIDICEYPRSRKRGYKFDHRRHLVKFGDVEETLL
jgi:uncharacterized cupin superfamily protein